MGDSNLLIDNSCKTLSMVNKLREYFEKDGLKTVRIATGYWDIPGLSLLADSIDNFLAHEDTELFLLIGKDPYVYASQLEEPKYKGAEYPQDFLKTDLSELKVTGEYDTAINLLLKYCGDDEGSKIKIRVYRKNANDEIQFLHSKCYIFEGETVDGSIGIGVIGSSNFTKKGLEGNAELNYVETNPYGVLSIDKSITGNKTHMKWFLEKWESSEPWNRVFLEQVLEPAPITKKVKEEKARADVAPYTPYELYIKLLQLRFGDLVDKDLSQQIESYLPQGILKLDYQIDAVKRCLNIMHEHGGFILADVVGLGKTIVATLIIKRFLTIPEASRRERKVLIITPPAIQPGWVKTVEMFDADAKDQISPNIDYLTTGSISGFVKEEDEEDFDDEMDSGEFEKEISKKNYGLIIIDESHKFRNSETQMYKALDELIENIWDETGEYPYIGLLSATPQNNRPNDLKNQIYLFERNHRESTLKKAEGGNIEKFFADADKEYKSLIRSDISIPEMERRERLEVLSKKIRDCILSDIMERRTRTDVKKYYDEDINEQGLIFPEISSPHKLEYIMDDELAELFYDTMGAIARTGENDLGQNKYLNYYRYRAIEYFKEECNKKKYAGRGNRDVISVSKQLATIMQTLLVKRLESSFAAFRQSLLNLRRYTENMIMMWENDTIFICPQLNINEEIDIEAKSMRRGKRVSFQECAEEIRKKIKQLTEDGRNEKAQNAEYHRADFAPDYCDRVKEDLELITSLCERWNSWAETSKDPKLEAFSSKLKPVLFDPKTNTSQKLVIFSEAIDTVNLLKKAVEDQNYRVLVVTAANRDEQTHVIEENFDANYEGEWKNDYDVLITTEVLAEGVNLHRANVVLNYDTPWNATRLIQRIGRVNRIGSKEPCVYVYNFFPSAEGDRKIKLVRKAYVKLQSFHTIFGEDNKVFSSTEEIPEYDVVKIIEGEESPMQKYVYELKQYKEAHPNRYHNIESETKEGVWEIASSEEGVAYFVVKSPKGGRLSIRLQQLAEAEVISDIDLLEEMRVDENTISVSLPKNWNELRDEALLTYNQYFVKINKSRAGDKRTKAIASLSGITKKLNSDGSMTEEYQMILTKTRRLIDTGNCDVIRKILQIEKNRGASLFELTNAEIIKILKGEIGKMVSKVEAVQGKASIVIGALKQ